MRWGRSTSCSGGRSAPPRTTRRRAPRLGCRGRLERGPHRVDPCGLQPAGGPVVEVAARRLLQRGEEVGQLGVRPFMATEVVRAPAQERLVAHPGHQLAQHRRTLRVGDAVEVHVHRVGVDHVGRDGVGGRQLVLPVRPRLPRVGERGPRAAEARGLGLGQDRGVGGEALVEPQVVPPAHGDEVAEPHVRQLVEDRLGPPLALGVGDLGAEHVGLEEGDARRRSPSRRR